VLHSKPITQSLLLFCEG